MTHINGHHVLGTARTVAKTRETLSSLSNITIPPLDIASTPSVAETTASLMGDLQQYPGQGLAADTGCRRR